MLPRPSPRPFRSNQEAEALYHRSGLASARADEDGVYSVPDEAHLEQAEGRDEADDEEMTLPAEPLPPRWTVEPRLWSLGWLCGASLVLWLADLAGALNHPIATWMVAGSMAVAHRLLFGWRHGPMHPLVAAAVGLGGMLLGFTLGGLPMLGIADLLYLDPRDFPSATPALLWQWVVTGGPTAAFFATAYSVWWRVIPRLFRVEVLGTEPTPATN